VGRGGRDIRRYGEELSVKGFERVKGKYWMHWLTPEAREALFYGEGPLYDALYDAAKLKPWAQYEGWSKFRNRVKQGKWVRSRAAPDRGHAEEADGQRGRDSDTSVRSVRGRPALHRHGFQATRIHPRIRPGKEGRYAHERGDGRNPDRGTPDGRGGEADANFYKDVIEELQGIDKTPPPKGAGKALFAAQNVARANHLTMAQVTNFILGTIRRW